MERDKMERAGEVHLKDFLLEIELNVSLGK